MWKGRWRHLITLLIGSFVAVSLTGQARAQSQDSAFAELKYKQEFTNPLTFSQTGQRIRLAPTENGSPSVTKTYSDKFATIEVSPDTTTPGIGRIIEFSKGTIPAGGTVRTAFSVRGNQVKKTDWSWTAQNLATASVSDRPFADPSFTFRGNRTTGNVTLTIRNDSARAIRLEDGRLSVSPVDPGLEAVDARNLGNTETPVTNVDLFVLNPGEATTLVFNVAQFLGADPSGLQVFFRATVFLTSDLSRSEPTFQVTWCNAFARTQGDPVSLLKELDRTVARPGDEITYTLTVENLLATPVNNVTVTDVAPPNSTYVLRSTFVDGRRVPDLPVNVSPLERGLNLGTLNAGAKTVITFQVRVNAETPPIRGICNIARVASDTTAPLASNEVCTEVEATSTDGTPPPVTVTKAVSPTTAAPGTPVTFTIIVSNTSTTTPATNVIVRDTLPLGLTYVPGSTALGVMPVSDVGVPPVSPLATVAGLTVPFIPAGGSVTVTFRATVNAGVASGTSLCNTAAAQATAGSTPVTSAPACVTVTIPTLTIAKTATPTAAPAGGTVTFTITVSNTGTAPATNVVVRDILPAGLTDVVAGNALTTTGVNVGTILPGGTVTLMVRATVACPPAAPAGTPFTNTATVTADAPVPPASATAVVTSTGDVTGPTVTILSPTAGQTFSVCETSLLVQALIQDACGLRANSVNILIDNTVVASGLAIGPNNLVTFTIGSLSAFGPGPHTLTVQAIDLAGNVGTASVTITLQCTVTSALEIVRRAEAAGAISPSSAAAIRLALLRALSRTGKDRCPDLRCALLLVRCAERTNRPGAMGLQFTLECEIACLLNECPPAALRLGGPKDLPGGP